MKKFAALIFTVLLCAAAIFSGCGGNAEIRFIVPDGGTLPPAVKLFYEKPEIAGKALVPEAGSAITVKTRLAALNCEAAIAPINVCAGAGEDYWLAGVAAWGNSYIISTEGFVPAVQTDLSVLQGEIIYAFGENDVPGLTLKSILRRNGVEPVTVASADDAIRGDTVYLLFLADAAAVKLQIENSGSRVKYAMLPEPNVTAMTASGARKIAFDLQRLWNPENPEDRYPQAGLLIRKNLPSSVIEAFLEKFAESAAYCLENPAETARIAKEELQSAALPPVAVLTQYIYGRGQQIMLYGSAKEEPVRTAVSAYLQEITGNAPEEAFYYR